MLFSATLLGYLSAFMIYLLLWLTFLGPHALGSRLSLLVFGVAWVVSSAGLRYRAESVEAILTRGALLGAAEWLMVALVGVIIYQRTLLNGRDLDPVVLISGISVSIILTMLCIIGWYLAKKVESEPTGGLDG